MPEISRFLGIVVTMLYNDHSPAHFHAKYGEFKITVEIESGIVEGKFPRRALSAVLEWMQLYKSELLIDWELAKFHSRLQNIPPLE